MSDTYQLFLKKKLPRIENAFNIVSHHPKLLLQACVHPSYKNEHQDIHFDNERLEFLGDAILNLVISEYLFINFPNENEGNLSLIRSSFVNAESCYKYITHMQLEDMLLIGKGESNNQKGRVSALANFFEALIGAIYLDQGIQPIQQLLPSLLTPIDHIHPQQLMKPKQRLQQITQKLFQQLPRYELTSSSSSNGLFQANVYICGELKGQGTAQSKKEAEQQAALQALSHYEHHD